MQERCAVLICLSPIADVTPVLTAPDRGVSRRIPELDGLRGIAILLVLVRHYVVNLVHAPAHSWVAYSMGALKLTWSGVDLFFVLSGYLIGGILLGARRSPRYFPTFYARRAFRILPLYYAWFGIYLLGLAASRMGHPAAPPLWAYLLFIQNFWMAFLQSFGVDWLRITWSLAVEEQFYLFSPLLIRFLDSRKLLIGLAAMITFVPVLRTILFLSGLTDETLYTTLPCRADSLGLGMLAALLLRRASVRAYLAAHRAYLYAASGILLCGMAMLTLRDKPALTYTAGYTWIAVFYLSLLLLGVVNPRPVERLILRSRWLRALGGIAYAVYLFHQGVNFLFHQVIFGRPPEVDSLASLGVTLCALIATLLLARISWRFFERPLVTQAHMRFQY